MAAKGACLAFGAAALAISSPAEAQVDNPGAEIVRQQEDIASINLALQGAEAEAAFSDGDDSPFGDGSCRRISQAINNIGRDVAAMEGKVPPGMTAAWRARLARLQQICPSSTGLIGDQQQPQTSPLAPQPQTPQMAPRPQDEFSQRQQRLRDAVERDFRRLEEARANGDCAEHAAAVTRIERYILDSEFWSPGHTWEWRERLNRARAEPCAPSTTLPQQPQQSQQPQSGGQIGQATPVRLAPADQRILDLHNRERTAFGLAPLSWNVRLAKNAQDHANQLARTGRLVHASREGRGIERENVNQGMLGWNTDQMLANWLNEKRNFIPGTFPNVSRTGNWSDVGHYSQMIWPQTTDIGCGMATGSGYQWLVCRYSPGGNKDGKPVGRVVTR